MSSYRVPFLILFTFNITFSTVANSQESFGEGTHVVGSDIQPGIYRTMGEISYFERLSGLSGEFDDIIANEAFPPSPVLVEIKEDDVAFTSQGPGIWIRIDELYNSEIKSSFNAGWWIVGVDIKAGLYRTVDKVNYYARLSDVSGELSAVITNEARTSGPVVIEIEESDYAFQSSGDVMWSLIDESYQPKLQESFGDGLWIVGVDIQPGVYRTNDDVLYYARLSGFGNNFSDIIENKVAVTGNSIIEILPTDTGFQTKGGAVWTIVDSSPTFIESSAWGTIKLNRIPE